MAGTDNEYMHLTHVELREFWDTVCCERRRVTDARLNAHDRIHEHLSDALAKAEIAVNVRLASMNELRDQINSERGALATKEALRAEIGMVLAKIDGIDRAQSNMEGRAWALTIALPLLISALVSAAINLAGRV